MVVVSVVMTITERQNGEMGGSMQIKPFDSGIMAVPARRSL